MFVQPEMLYTFGLVSLAYLIYLLYTTNSDPKRQGFHDHYANTVVVKRA